MATFAEWAGYSRKITTAVDIKIGSLVRVTQIEATASGVEAALPDARRFGRGGPILVVWNTGSESIDVTDHDGGAFKTLDENEMVVCLLIDNSTAAGEWRGQVEATDAIPTSGPNDFFYTIGGQDTAYNKSPWQYDYSVDSWVAGTNATNSMTDCGGVAASGVGYISSDSGTFTVQKYDPDTWTVLGNSSRTGQGRDAAADLARGEWYGVAFGTTNAHDRYDTDTDTWSSGTNFPTNHNDGAATWIESGKIMIYGGDANSFVANVLNREHTVSTDSFVTKTSMAQQRLKLGHFHLGGDVFAVGGSVDANGPFLDRTDSYNLAGDAWTTRQDWPDGLRWKGPAAGARAAGIAYAVGGEDSKEANSYQVDTWTALASHSALGSHLRGAEDSSLTLNVS